MPLASECNNEMNVQQISGTFIESHVGANSINLRTLYTTARPLHDTTPKLSLHIDVAPTTLK